MQQRTFVEAMTGSGSLATSSPAAEEQQNQPPSPMSTMNSTSFNSLSAQPDGVPQLTFNLGDDDRIFTLPAALLSKPAIRNSKLCAVSDSMTLSDGTTVARKEPFAFHVCKPNGDYSSFALVIDHLVGKRPLESCSFRTVIGTWRQLLDELKVWDLPFSSVELPHLLWTNSRWSDLIGMYALNPNDAEVLKNAPVALQLEDGTIQGVRQLTRVNLSPSKKSMLETTENHSNSSLVGRIDTTTTTATASDEKESKTTVNKPVKSDVSVEEVTAMLPVDVSLSQVTAVFSWQNHCLVLLGPVPNVKRSSGGLIDSTPVLPVSPSQHEDATPAGSSSPSGFDGRSGTQHTSSPNKYSDIGNAVVTILVRLPGSTSKVVAYDLPKNERLLAPDGAVYPLYFRLYDRHLYVLSPAFALEVHEMHDATLGTTKIRCGTIRVPTEIGMNKHTSILGPSYSASSNASSLVSGLFKTTAGSKKETWRCHHPSFGTRYNSTMKCFREMSEVSCVRFYPWGSLFISGKVESVFAVLAVEQDHLKRMYGSHIQVYLKNLPVGLVSRDEIDVTAGPELDRIYLCCANQIASNAVVPLGQGQTTNKVDFELFAINGRPKLKLVHMDIPEGAPSGSSLGSLNCLGVLSEYDIYTSIYFQNKVSRALCVAYRSETGESFEFNKRNVN